jgi:hypothetical protein
MMSSESTTMTSQNVLQTSVRKLAPARTCSTSRGAWWPMFPANLLVLLAVVLCSCTRLSQAYPATMLVFHHPSSYSSAQSFNGRIGGDVTGTSSISKRAFDRLDMSPFDFEALSKRYNDDDDYTRRKKAFDRLDENGFFGMLRKRRAFDRLDDNSFILGRKRSVPDTYPDSVDTSLLLAKRPFDRLDTSAFGIVKKSDTAENQRLSIAQVLDRYPQLPLYRAQSNAAQTTSD